MKKFSFELEDLLSLKKFQQEQAQIELGKAVAKEVQIQDGLKALAVEHANTKKNISGSKDFFEITKSQQYFSFLKLQEEHLLDELATAKLVTEEKRQIFKTAFQKTQSLKKLKEQKKADYNNLVNKEEEDIVDDISNSQFKISNS